MARTPRRRLEDIGNFRVLLRAGPTFRQRQRRLGLLGIADAKLVDERRRQLRDTVT
jgi:hypothetical protein